MIALARGPLDGAQESPGHASAVGLEKSDAMDRALVPAAELPRLHVFSANPDGHGDEMLAACRATSQVLRMYQRPRPAIAIP